MFTIGDRVKYKADFLRSISCYTGPLPFARGTIIQLKTVGPLTLAVIDWDKDKEEIPERVNINNLEKSKK